MLCKDCRRLLEVSSFENEGTLILSNLEVNLFDVDAAGDSVAQGPADHSNVFGVTSLTTDSTLGCFWLSFRFHAYRENGTQ